MADATSTTAQTPGWSRWAQRLTGSTTIYWVTALLLLAIETQNHNFFQPSVFLNFLGRAVPLMIIAQGQLFVIATGGFDLSMGAVMLVTVLGGALLARNDPTTTWWLILLMFIVGIVIGLVNGAVTSFLRIPSFITTLGMSLILQGAILQASGGAPSGYLPDNFRFFGRGFIQVPLIGNFPVSLLVLIVFSIIYIFLMHKANVGREVLAVGDNPRTSLLSGIQVPRVRILAFIFSAVSAIVGGIVLGGFSGVSNDAGIGYELQAIAAVVLGGGRLGGGQGSVPGAMAGALSLQALFTLLNLLRLPEAVRDAAEGLILIGVAAYAAYRTRKTR